jgi:hypothetical protein
VHRHPVDAVGREAVDEGLPVLAVEQLGLAVQQLLDLGAQACMYSRQARNWLRITASDVPLCE